jgi:hypothetical protein
MANRLCLRAIWLSAGRGGDDPGGSVEVSQIRDFLGRLSLGFPLEGDRHSLLYKLYVGSPVWCLRRWWWFVTSDRRCARCRRRLVLHGGGPATVTVHHRTYARLGRERRTDIELLCWACHRSVDGWRSR